MKTSRYFIFCLILSVSLFLAIQFVPGFSDAIETRVLTFLSTNAS